ncbi:tumor necrosis factor receptor superfamily member 6B-like [Scleropages formosus]|uniref:tumor necrosis factor receptor superfamily member 6B-like n=1 Tax=Scleropages formosus TaxID=113540 RepID=UPI0008781AE0|nr:tumor necrosis factor receptor superfamily member 6B-like [Scleropages formosus]
MEKRGSFSLRVTLLMFISLVGSELSGNCPRCDPGFIPQGCKCIRCPKNTYWLMRQGHAFCERCTMVCSAQRHLVEVSACTSTSNRECHCQAGFFCTSAAQYTCRRCKPCPEGTFSNVTSRSKSCQSYTDCTTLGMAVITKGSRTHDQVCGSLMTALK